jgi:hypothetical protein
MKQLSHILQLLLGVAFLTGCAGTDFQPTANSVGSRRSINSGSSTSTDNYDYSVAAPSDPIPTSTPDTSAADAINQMNQQMATQAQNDAAQQQFLAGMAAAQETMNNANNGQQP